MTILPLTYLGNTEYFGRLLHQECIIDLGENYVKQSYRNRCEILSAAGVMSLTVNVVKGGSRIKCPVKEMRIDYSKRWQHQHWISILSAYKRSPYFDHYAPQLEGFFSRRYDFLCDLNIGLLETVLHIGGYDSQRIHFSDSYVVPTSNDLDLRGEFDPSKRFASARHASPYYQVFNERMPFEANLSIIDLLLTEGPDFTEFLPRY